MKDPLPKSTYHRDTDGLKVIESNEIRNSIPQSVTNDEDDLFNSKKNSAHSIVRSVTNDEDEWIESSDSGRHVPLSVQDHPRNYTPEFSKQTSTMNGLKQTESIVPQSPRVSIIGSEPFNNNHFEKESFLIRYEQMMIDQEKEQLSTISHLQFFLELLLDLQPDEKYGLCRRQQLDDDKEICLLIEFSIEDLKQAQKKLKNSEKYDIVKTDKQFLMVLDIFCDDKSDFSYTDTSEKKERKISWAEIIQCYRHCVAGMQTLEKIGGHRSIRNRAKERTIALLSGYGVSSFTNGSPSTSEISGIDDLAYSEKESHGMNVVDLSRIDPVTLKGIESRGLLNHRIVSFFVGAIFGATLLYGCLSISHSITLFNNPLFARQAHYMKPPTGDHDYWREFGVYNSSERSIEESTDTSDDFLRQEKSVSDSNYFKRKSLITPQGRTPPSIVKARANDSTSNFPLESSKMILYKPNSNISKENDDNITTKKFLSTDMKVANVLGGTATILYVLSSSTVSVVTVLGWLPTGLGVAAAAFAARGVRSWISNIRKAVNLNRNKFDTVSI